MFNALRELFRTQVEPVTAQRRHYRRFHCSVPVRCVTGDPAMIVDIAAEGLRLQTLRSYRPGSLLTLRFGGHAAEPLLRTRVVWCERHGSYNEVGVVYSEADSTMSRSWAPPLLKSLARSNRYLEDRRSVRFESRLVAALRVADTDVEGTVVDLSSGGASFSGSVTASVGSTVSLRVTPRNGQTLQFQGRVVRRGRGGDGRTVYGIRFENPNQELPRLLSSLVIEQRTSRPRSRVAASEAPTIEMKPRHARKLG